MSSEFKRIFKIVDKDKVKLSELYITVEQYYLNFYPRIRCRNHSDNCTMTVKVIINENEKVEHAMQISKEEYEALKEKRVTKLIQKHRCSASFGNEIGIYDRYFGDLDGIETLSMEFGTKEEMDNFVVPDFLIETGEVMSIDDMKL